MIEFLGVSVCYQRGENVYCLTRANCCRAEKYEDFELRVNANFLDQLWRSTVRLQRSLAKKHTMESLLSATQCRKAPKTPSKLQAQGSSGLQRSKKITQTSTLIVKGQPRARTPSSSTSVAIFSMAGAHPA